VYKVIIPGMKKVLNGFVCGISKEVEFKGGGAFRYYELESYEESLENCEYILSSDNALIDYRKSRKLIKGLKKGENIYLDMSKYDKNFDIFVTMSNLLGLKIKNIFIDDNGIKSCRFENGDTVNLENIDLIKYPKLRNLIWWEK
ncbi:site-specific DNA-methyltransferase, partial [Campylobacter jejuni]|nr:site-specific DNA-methyltransferase [Campylobacter jejuni]